MPSKRALKRIRAAVGLPVCREPLPSHAWPGGYPVYYLHSDGETACPGCANAHAEQIDESARTNARDGWALIASDVNYECAELYCAHCSRRIPSSYAEDAAPPGPTTDGQTHETDHTSAGAPA